MLSKSLVKFDRTVIGPIVFFRGAIDKKPKTNNRKQLRSKTKQQGQKRNHQKIKTKNTNAKIHNQQKPTSRKK